jgi:hypothetical protein
MISEERIQLRARSEDYPTIDKPAKDVVHLG